MAVPTHDAHGRRLAACSRARCSIDGFDVSSGSLDLGFSGFAVLDRNGRELLAGFAQPRNAAPRRRLRGTRSGCSRACAGSTAAPITSSPTPPRRSRAGRSSIDRPRADVFAAARRGLLLELALIAAAAAVVVLPDRLAAAARPARGGAPERARAPARRARRTRSAPPRYAAEVARGLAAALATAFPDALAVVALEAEDRLGLELAACGAPASSERARDRAHRCARLRPRVRVGRRRSRSSDEQQLRDELPELHAALGGGVQLALLRAAARRRGSRPIGALCLVFASERALDEDERAHVAWYAEEAALGARPRAQLRARARRRGQPAAQPARHRSCPRSTALELLGRYQAGSAGLEVGGDWYDVVRRSDGIVHITVGDVAGRGITAAVLMGQMRNAFRAYAYDHASPAEVLRRMRRHVAGEEMATAVCLDARPVHPRADLRLGRPPAARCSSTAPAAPSRASTRAGAPPLGFAQAETIREADVALPAPARRSSPTPTA